MLFFVLVALYFTGSVPTALYLVHLTLSELTARQDATIAARILEM